jgi:hypothetical protein
MLKVPFAFQSLLACIAVYGSVVTCRGMCHCAALRSVSCSRVASALCGTPSSAQQAHSQPPRPLAARAGWPSASATPACEPCSPSRYHCCSAGAPSARCVVVLRVASCSDADLPGLPKGGALPGVVHPPTRAVRRATPRPQDLYVGLSPYTAPGVYSLLAATELTDGVWYPLGGFGQVRCRRSADAVTASCVVGFVLCRQCHPGQAWGVGQGRRVRCCSSRRRSLR